MIGSLAHVHAHATQRRVHVFARATQWRALGIETVMPTECFVLLGASQQAAMLNERILVSMSTPHHGSRDIFAYHAQVACTLNTVGQLSSLWQLLALYQQQQHSPKLAKVQDERIQMLEAQNKPGQNPALPHLL